VLKFIGQFSLVQVFHHGLQIAQSSATCFRSLNISAPSILFLIIFSLRNFAIFHYAMFFVCVCIACKSRSRNDLYCVGWDAFTHSLTHFGTPAFSTVGCVIAVSATLTDGKTNEPLNTHTRAREFTDDKMICPHHWGHKCVYRRPGVAQSLAPWSLSLQRITSPTPSQVHTADIGRHFNPL